jgi:hypothetical protein
MKQPEKRKLEKYIELLIDTAENNPDFYNNQANV